MARSRFEDILQNLHFSENTKDTKSDKGYKVRSLINHFNQSFSISVSNDDSQGVDEHMKLSRWNSKVDQAWNNISKASQPNEISSFGIVVVAK